MDNLCKRCYHNYVCEQYNENRDLTRTKCDYKNSHFIDAADVVPVRHGRWLGSKHKIFSNTYDYVCSKCGCDYALAKYNYCPNCGAIMDGDRL